MARVANAFYLLDDEEGDDMSLLIEHAAHKKVDVPVGPPTASVEKKKRQQQPRVVEKELVNQGTEGGADWKPTVRAQGGRGRGGRGRGPRWDSEQFANDKGNGYGRNYDGDSNANSFDDAPRGRGRGRGRGGRRGRGRGRESGFNVEYGFQNQKDAYETDPIPHEVQADGGWEHIPQPEGDEERPMRNYNRNFSGERRGGNRGFRGRRDGFNYARGRESNDSEVKETSNGGNEDNSGNDNGNSERDAAAVTEVVQVGESEEKKSEEVIVGENSVKKDEEDEEKFMTLEEYEKVLANKRKALEAVRMQERKVTLDKDLEAMQLLEKKKEEDNMQKPEKEKLKRKDSLDGEKEKVKSKSEIVREIFVLPSFERGRGRGRARGRGEFKSGGRGHGDLRTGDRGIESDGWQGTGDRAKASSESGDANGIKEQVEAGKSTVTADHGENRRGHIDAAAETKNLYVNENMDGAGRIGRGGFRGGFRNRDGGTLRSGGRGGFRRPAAPKIEDPSQFPTLGPAPVRA